MRIAKVIGKVVFSRKLDEVLPGNYLVVRTCNRGTLAGNNEGNEETPVIYDSLAAREGDLVGMVEGREATAPFYPRKVPYECYCASILDTVDFEPVLGDTESENRREE